MGNQPACSKCGNDQGLLRWYCSNCGSYWCVNCTGKSFSAANDKSKWPKCLKCGTTTTPK